MSDTKIENTPTSSTERTEHEERYEPLRIEEKWSAQWWSQPELFKADPIDSAKKKYYVLEMLPYPRACCTWDTCATTPLATRSPVICGCAAITSCIPMGWDSFGLPAENAAIKNKRPPKEWTLGNIGFMKQQMKRLGFAYDWDREVTTCLPDYYKWNQWFFIKMFEKGLAYRKKSKVNWCPECATVLANEQVVGGCCWRHETTTVEQRELEQWFVRTTNYADELLRDLDKLEGWPEKVKTMQRNWIGRSEGAVVDFKVEIRKTHPSASPKNGAPRSRCSPPALTRFMERPRFSLRPSTR